MTDVGKRWSRHFVLLVAVAVLAAACGGSGSGATTTTAASGGQTTTTAGSGGQTTTTAPEGPVELSLDAVDIAINGEAFSMQVDWYNTVDRFLPEVGFTGESSVVFTFEGLAALLGGSVWVVQEKIATIYPAIEAGIDDIVIVGIDKDATTWRLGVREGIESPEDLIGKRLSAGPVGDPWYNILSEMLRELGVDEDDVELVSIDGNSDARLNAILAGQIDGGVLVTRNVPLLEEAGGSFLFNRPVEFTNEVWVVTRKTWEENRDAVCAFVEARVAAKQWLTAGPENRDNREEAVQTLLDLGIEPNPSNYTDWAWADNPVLWSLDGGIDRAAIDWHDDFLVRTGVSSEGFDPSPYWDFTCVWEAQEKLGLPLNPNPDDM